MPNAAEGLTVGESLTEGKGYASAGEMLGEWAEGAENSYSRLQKTFDLVDDYKLSDDIYHNHIVERHGLNGSSFPNKSKFNSDFDIKKE